MSVVSYETQGKYGLIRLNNPPVNALSQALRQGIIEAVEKAQVDDCEVILLLCEGRTFIAGSDISEFGKPPLEPSLPKVCQTLETSAKPVIALLHGTALGGGFEVALSCHYRIALDTTQVGLPEVKLGLIPGSGGTQRVPRLAGVKAALDLITSGDAIAADKALSIQLVDHVVKGDLLVAAMVHIDQLINQDYKFTAVGSREACCEEDSTALLDQYRKTLSKRKRGQQAPQYIVDSIEDSLILNLQDGLAAERKRFVACRESEQSAAMRHVFFAERNCARVKGLDRNTTHRDIQQVAVIGGGTMGAGIAICFLDAGFQVILLEINAEALDAGISRIHKHYARMQDKGRIGSENAKRILSGLTGTFDYQDLSESDLVIEAVFENLEVKQEVFKKLESVCKPGAVLATNTSYQNVNEIAKVTARPQDVVGMHFFSPANIMRLLEIVRADATADDVLVTMLALAKRIGKISVVAGVCYGFIGNRMLRAYTREAQQCLLQGATPEQIDRVMEDFGMAMGPLAVGDLAGLDIGYKARQALIGEDKDNPQDFCIADTLAKMGRLGQKAGSGYYRYEAGSRQRNIDPEVQTIIESQSQQYGVTRKPIGEQTILERLLGALISEGEALLNEGIAQRASDIDLVYIHGYGFPAYRGGPMFFNQ